MAWVSTQKCARCESVSTVVPDLLETMYPVWAGSMAPVTRVMASGIGRVEHVQGRLAVRAPEGAAQHLGAQARSAHPEQDTVAPSGFTHFDGERLERRNPFLHGTDNVEPTQAVVDHLGVSRVSRLPGVGVAVPDAGGDLRCGRCVKRHGGPARVDVLPLRVSGTERIDLLGNAADQLIVRVGELLDAIVE